MQRLRAKTEDGETTVEREGVKEKDVNLGVALKLGKLIEQNLKDVKVVYTRDNDKFVELYKQYHNQDLVHPFLV